jgi:DNA-directed RNA polymerase subunit RPC12/RpoP
MMTLDSFLVFAFIALPMMAFALGYDRGVRRAIRAEAALDRERLDREKQPTYRDPAKAQKRKEFFELAERAGDPGSGLLAVGPMLLKDGPERFKRSCGRCGSQFSYRLEDTRPGSVYAKVNCPKCGHTELHTA